MAKWQNATMRQVLTVGVFVAALGGFFVANRLFTPPEISQSERRALAKLPKLTVNSLLTADFMDGFESFAADSFVMRDGLRAVRAASVYGLFMQTDKSGLYMGDFGAGKFESVDQKSYRSAAGKIRRIAEEHLGGLNVYYAVIPDKSYYEPKAFPGFRPDPAREAMDETLSALTRVDLDDILTGRDFYRTDLHWNQPALAGVYEALGGAMGLPDAPYFEVASPGEFSGVYPGQVALPMRPDIMKYIVNAHTEGASVSYLDDRTGEMVPGPMYDLDAFAGGDPYDLFLRGAQALVVIDNPSAATDRELYMFRDSFSSSLAPWLTAAYRRVTLIDLRYMDSRVLPMFVEFTPGADVLFIYSSLILGNESILLAPN
jgi:hypothetical protein